MYSLIAILGPSVIGVKILDYLKRGLGLKNTLYYYLILLVLSTIFNVTITYLLLGTENNLFVNLNIFPILLVKYMILSLGVNVVLSLIIFYLQKNITIVAEAEKVEKKKNKKFFRKNK